MDVTICKDYKVLSQKAGDYIIKQLDGLRFPLVSFAAGQTPLGVFENLVRRDDKSLSIFKSAYFIGLDEWVGMNQIDQGSCRNTLDQNFFNILKISDTNIYFFDGQSLDLEDECHRMNLYLEENGPLDLILLGIGLNGHIGLNEPGTPFDSVCRVVELKYSTQKTGQKYFNQSKNLSRGLTLGMRQILDARSIVLLANGAEKADVVKILLTQKINEKLPASALLGHPNCQLFVDSQAYWKLSLKES